MGGIDVRAAAEWSVATLANRMDAHGHYAEGEAFTSKVAVTIDLVERHYRGEVVIGLHAIAPDGTCRWGCADVDAHDGNRERAELVAFQVHDDLTKLGANPVLEDSGGGFHVWLLAALPVTATAMRAFVRPLVPLDVEVFPKQDLIRDGGFGSWVRLPGRHPRLDTWSRFWDPAAQRWVEWPEGLAILTESERCPVSLLPEHEGEPEPTSRASPEPVQEEVPIGRRNATLTSLAGSMRRRGMTREEIEAALLAVNRRRCRPPLDDDEVRRIAESVARYDPVNGGTGEARGRAEPTGQAPADIDTDGLTKAIADAILSGHRYAQDAGRKLYVYTGGVYRSGGEEHVKRRVKAVLAECGQLKSWNSHRAGEVVEYIRLDAPLLWERPPADRVNVSNGILDVSRRVLLPHDPEFLSSVQIAACYDPSATCPAWDKFASEVFPEDAVVLAYEIPACLMIPGLLQKRAVLLVGEGDNGKSVYLRAVISFLGKRNVASATLHKLEADRFSAARLIGRLANICPDLPSEHLKGTSIFKAITGGDVMGAERKFKEAFEFEPFSRLVFSANHLPRSADASDAFFRRWAVVPFGRRFEPHEQVPRAELDARLATPAELSGVLNRALDVLPGLVSRGYTLAQSTAEALAEFRYVTDPVAVWLERHTVLVSTAVVAKDALFSAYQRHAAEAGHPAITKTAFGRQVKESFPGIDEKQRTLGTKLTWCWIGLGLAAEGQQP